MADTVARLRPHTYQQNDARARESPAASPARATLYPAFLGRSAATVPLAPLILIGLLLTAAGIYGVLAFAIARRSRELATRVAMGAKGLNLMKLIAAQTFRLLAIGSFLAVAVTFALTRVVRAAGGGGSAFDTPGPGAFVLPVLIVMGFGMLATWIPARRTLSIDPAIVLKGE